MKKTLLDKMQCHLDEIVAEWGYQEMADGFEQAMNIVKNSEGKLWKATEPTNAHKRARRRPAIIR